MSAVCQPWNGRMSVISQPYVSRIFAVCQPYLISQYARNFILEPVSQSVGKRNARMSFLACLYPASICHSPGSDSNIFTLVCWLNWQFQSLLRFFRYLPVDVGDHQKISFFERVYFGTFLEIFSLLAGQSNLFFPHFKNFDGRIGESKIVADHVNQWFLKTPSHKTQARYTTLCWLLSS